jgi:flagellar L-ring protein precursor FlgH
VTAQGAKVRGCDGALVHACIVVIILMAAPVQAEAQRLAPANVSATAAASKAGKTSKKKVERKEEDENYDELFQQYLAAARSTQAVPSADSLWMAGLFGDLRARRVNDLVTVRVIETISAQGSADSTLAKDSSAGIGVPNLFGLETKYPKSLDPSSLAQLAASTAFKGSGSTTRNGALSAVITARVAEVLPNGDLGIEGVREIDINGDRQIVVMTGVIRQSDIGPGNVVPSTAVGQMRIRYFGRGLIKDNLTPGILVRILNKIF